MGKLFKLFQSFLVLTALLFIFACEGEKTVGTELPDVPETPQNDNQTSLSNIQGKLGNLEALVVNTLSETLSGVYKGNPLTVSNNITDASDKILSTGVAPNQILAKNGLAFILNSLSNNLQIINLNEPSTLTEISTGTGSNPYYMTFYEDENLNRIYITNLLGGSDSNGNIFVIDITENGFEPTAVIDLPSGDDLKPFAGPTSAKPQGICTSNSKIYVTLTNMAGWTPGGPGMVVVIDPASNAIIDTIETTGLNPSVAYSSKFDPDHVYVINTGTYTGDGVIDVIDAKTDEIISSLPIGGAPSIMTMTENKTAFVTDALGAHLFSFNAVSYEIIHDASDPIAVADSTDAFFLSYIDISADGKLYALAFGTDMLYIINPSTYENIEGPYLLGDGPISFVLDK